MEGIKARTHPDDVVIDEDTVAAHMAEWRHYIRIFIRDIWGLSPQPVKPQYEEAFDAVCAANGQLWESMKKTVKPEWFGDYNRASKSWEWYSPEGTLVTREQFLGEKYYSWQQNLILIGVEKAVASDASRKLSTRSGHGIGKSATCSWIVLWFLFCFMESQVACTAPTTGQMHDVLWKELSIWINRMPENIGSLYQWQSDYVRMNYSPESWFARARTSTKENTEAIAGVHAESVLIVVDEASGVPNEVFETAEGALTGGNVLVILISNPTQTSGYFYDTHHKAARDWQLFAFSSEESPLVDKQFVLDKLRRHGRESEEFGIRVGGVFPRMGSLGTDGYLQLIQVESVKIRLLSDFEIPFIGRKILGVDPAGEGKDSATFVLRDRFKMQLIDEMQTSNDKEIAERILLYIDRYKLDPNDVVVGAFGTGADVGKHIALAGAEQKKALEIYTVMEGSRPEKEERYNGKFFERMPDELTNPDEKPEEYIDLYANIRALMYFRLAKWISAGGVWIDTSVDNSPFAEQVSGIRYKRAQQGNQIQLMPKKDMLKIGIPSPNVSDAAAFTLLRSMEGSLQGKEERDRIEAEESNMTEDERFSST